MVIETVPSGPIDTNAYLVADSSEGMVIDPSKDSTPKLLELAKKHNTKIIYIIDTHGHWDHIADNFSIQNETGARVLIHKNDEKMITNPGSNMFHIPFEIKPTKASLYLEEGTRIPLGTLRFRVLHTPGHTPGSVCLYEEDRKIIFTGDTLFQGTYGRTDFTGGDPDEMKNSLSMLSKLPSDVEVFPGHGPPTTIGNEPWLSRI